MKLSKRLPSTSAQIILRERYEDAFGVYNHKGQEGTHPLALVMHNWSEDNVTGGRLRERMEAFAENGVAKHFNISFHEFIQQPTYVCDMMLDVSEAMNQRDVNSPEAAELKRLAESMKNTQPGK